MFRVNLELTVKHPAWFSVNGGIGVSGLWFLIIVLEAPCNSACTYLLHIKNQPAASMRNSWNKNEHLIAPQNLWGIINIKCFLLPTVKYDKLREKCIDIVYILQYIYGYLQISFRHIALDNQLILLSIPATDNQVIFTADEPIEFFKPVNFSHMSDRSYSFFLQMSRYESYVYNWTVTG